MHSIGILPDIASMWCEQLYWRRWNHLACGSQGSKMQPNQMSYSLTTRAQ